MIDHDQLRSELNFATRNILLKQIIINQAAILACELEQKHNEATIKLIKKAIMMSATMSGEMDAILEVIDD